MSAIRMLKEEHQQILSFFNRMSLEESLSVHQREQLFRQIKECLEAHTHIEEKILFVACRQHGSLRRLVRNYLDLHHLIRHLLAEVGRYEVETDEWVAGFHSLRDTVEDHFASEERELYPAVERLLDQEQLSRMADEMEVEKIKLNLNPKESWHLIMQGGQQVPSPEQA